MYSKCLISKHNFYSVGVKIKHTVQNQISFQNASLMIIPAETWATTKEKNPKIYALVRRNLMVYTEN